MKVGILGSGDVAKALGTGFIENGHDVMMGTRDATKLSTWADESSGARVGSFAETAQHGDLVVLWCIPGFLRDQWDHAFKLLE